MNHTTPNAAIIATLLLSGSFVARADSTSEQPAALASNEFQGHIVFCAPPGGPVDVEVLPDGTEIVTFVNIGNVWQTGHPLIDGVEENQVEAIIDPSPVEPATITGSVDVDAVVGTWQFQQLLVFGPGVVVSYGVGFGTGDLLGKIVTFEAGPIEEIQNSPCGVPVGAPIKGRIIDY